MMKISKRLPVIWFAAAVGILSTCCIVLATPQVSGVNYFFSLTTIISPYQRQLLLDC